MKVRVHFLFAVAFKSESARAKVRAHLRRLRAHDRTTYEWTKNELMIEREYLKTCTSLCKLRRLGSSDQRQRVLGSIRLADDQTGSPTRKVLVKLMGVMSAEVAAEVSAARSMLAL